MESLRIDSSARVTGTLRVGENVYVAQGAAVRSVGDSVSFGNDTWVLENSVVVGTPEHPVRIGSKTVFGHKCIVIGAQVGDLCEIGNGTIFLPGARVGSRCRTGEGTIIPAGAVIPDDAVVVGRPGRVIRSLTEEDMETLRRMRGYDISLGPVTEHTVKFESKEGDQMGKLYISNGKCPVVHETACIYDTAEVTGDVMIGSGSIIASGVRIIGNSHGPVRIGDDVQILENTVLHLLPDNELIIGDHVTIGPGCVIHGTNIGAHCVIESGAIVCDYSVLGENTLVMSGSLIKQRSEVPGHKIMEGFPAKVVGGLEEVQKRPSWAMRDGVPARSEGNGR